MNDLPAPDSESRPPVAEFVTTHWSVVLAAGDMASAQADAALAELCRTYWYPLYAFVRRKGHSPHDAQDLTQAFSPAAGEELRRARLIASAAGSAPICWQRSRTSSRRMGQARRLKRGGGREIISFDAASAEERYRLEPIDQLDAAKLYERRWVTTLFDKVLGAA
jgi:RNA polymerase sigma-70 factor (ECF subfamily)